MSPTRPTLILLTSLAFLSGCAGPPGVADGEHFAQPWLDDPRLKEWEKLADMKASIRSRGGMQPHMQETAGVGTMFVWKHALSGGPGWEFLRATYSYQNTTEEAFDTIKVWIEVVDARGEVVSRKEDFLMHPLGYALSPGDTWSDVMKVPTKGAHETEGWTWRVGCAPVLMKVLPQKRLGG